MGALKGGDKLEARLAQIARKLGTGGKVRVGFLEGARYPDGTPVATIAAIQNFGAPAKGIPPRPFFSNMIADKSGDWGDSLAAILKSNGGDVKAALELMGMGMAGQLRQAIVDTQAPPNSPVTNLLKQRFPKRDGMTFADVQQARADVAEGATAPAGKPLVWSGDMLNAIDHEVET